MRTIWKFELKVGENKVKMPDLSDILSIGEQDGKVMMWVEVDDKADQTERPILVVGTGQEINEEYALEFIGTVTIVEKIVVDMVKLVWHVFEII